VCDGIKREKRGERKRLSPLGERDALPARLGSQVVFDFVSGLKKCRGIINGKERERESGRRKGETNGE
jgi:hypothetical protein